MRLQKLIISGFGPYASTQTLDFESNLQDKSMFVISGNTGAGKTTIFDAINFALYGSANGSEREGKSLRSDFAKPDTNTEVELWFSLRNKQYYVKRSPQYERPKQRGEGTTRKSASAEIKDIILEKTITGYVEVTNEVEKILGINSSQFKQLVMIPQGEFKKLLSADSKDKEAIFRKIFATEAFEQIQKQITENANTLKKNFDTQALYKKSVVGRFKHDMADELLNKALSVESPNYSLIAEKFEEISKTDNALKEELSSKLSKIKIACDNLTIELVKGEETNRKFGDFKEKNLIFSALMEKKNEFDHKKKLLDLAKKALEVKSFEERYLEKSDAFSNKESELRLLNIRIEELSTLYHHALLEFEAHKNNEPQKIKIQRDLDKIRSLKEKTAIYEIKKKSYLDIADMIEKYSDQVNKINEKIAADEIAIKACTSRLENISLLILETSKLETICNTYREIAVKINKLVKSIGEYVDINASHITKSREYEILDKEFTLLKKSCDSIEDAFRRNQAGLIAKDLAKGIPCPVCGSLDHPIPATLENYEVGEDVLKESKIKLEKNRDVRDSAQKELTSLYENLKSLKKNSILPLLEELFDISNFEKVEEIYVPISKLKESNLTKGKELKAIIDENQKIIQEEPETKEAKNQAENEILRLQEEKTVLTQSLENQKIEISAITENLKSIKADFEGEIKSISQLENEEKTATDQLTLMSTALINSEKNYNNLKETLDRESGQQTAKKAEIKNLEDEKINSKNQFHSKLIEIGFSDEAHYRKNLLNKADFEAIENDIRIFSENLRDAEISLKQAEKNIAGLDIVDLDEIRQKLYSVNENQKNIEVKTNEIYAKIQNNDEVLSELNNINNKITKLETEFAIIGDLAKIIRGDNSSKISFERYVLASYYEDIIEAANLRFNKISSGRFELSRKQEVGDARKGNGLDLEVFDNYTGKSRDVKTLSGGESFKASLSMALGLADVVQSYAGGIQLDTMFIDEGFGTLDPESLDKAIECLIDLQNDGRVVGIISHVPELKERIGTKLEVSMTNSGSKAEFIVD